MKNIGEFKIFVGAYSQLDEATRSYLHNPLSISLF